jgi:DNA-binding transcriptional ArsR family regulator
LLYKKIMNFNNSVKSLRALAEPTRCRLLSLLMHGELTVGEIAAALMQSQPRISRHLKILTDVAALERFREEQRIYYRIVPGTLAHDVINRLFASGKESDKTLIQDRTRGAQVLQKRLRDAAVGWASVRQAAEARYKNPHITKAVLQAVGSDSVGDLLDVGTGSGSFLGVLAPRARSAVGLDNSTAALRVARARVHGNGLAHCLFKRANMYDLPFEKSTFDTITFDHVLSTAEHSTAALREAVRVLRADGQVIVLEHSELAVQIRQWLKAAGLRCKKQALVGTTAQQLLLIQAQR